MEDDESGFQMILLIDSYQQMNLIIQAFNHPPPDRVQLSLAGSINNLNVSGPQGGNQRSMVIQDLKRTPGSGKAHQGDLPGKDF